MPTIQENSLAFTSIDHNTIKQSLKNYLKNQDIFQSYDFEASSMSVLLSLLAYNTSTLAFYLNMDISESWLDSAQLRESISSHAKVLNYLPRSARSPVAKVKVRFQASGASQPYTIAKGSSFTTVVNQFGYQFAMPETLVVSSSNTTFEFETEILEGSYLKDAFIYQTGTDTQRFRISNRNVDTRSIVVSVFEDNAELGEEYTYASSLLGLNERSEVFFLQPAGQGYYEIFFGDNVIGKTPKAGSYILIDYRVTEGDRANGAKTFSFNPDPTGNGELTGPVNVITIDAAFNGAGPETNESIKYYAPRHFQVQERATAEQDYEIALKTQFPEINAVSVYGGEKLTPPKFGRVYISVDISNVEGLPQSKIDQYTAFINSRNSLGITPVFVEASLLYWAIESTVKYNINVTDSTAARIRTLATDTIVDYNEEFLNDFNAKLEFSRLSTAIDASDVSIVSNQSQLKLYRKTNPPTLTSHSRIISFNQAISELDGSISSTSFVFNGTLCQFTSVDGVLWIKNVRNQRNIKSVGTVDYVKGTVSYNSLSISSYEGNALQIAVVPKSTDIFSTANDILTIEPSHINVTAIPVRQ